MFVLLLRCTVAIAQEMRRIFQLAESSNWIAEAKRNRRALRGAHAVNRQAEPAKNTPSFQSAQHIVTNYHLYSMSCVSYHGGNRVCRSLLASFSTSAAICRRKPEAAGM